MNHQNTRVIVGALALIAGTAAAAADRVVIDTEQKAAAAAMAVHSWLIDSGQELTVPRYLTYLTFPSRDLAFGALKMLAPATTPAALADMRHGLSLPCLHGGTLTARMARNEPRVLRLQWADCVVQQYEYDDTPDTRHTLNGPATLELSEDSFAPSALTLLRLGNATASVTAFSSGTPTPEFTSFATRSFNLRMTGNIPMTRTTDGFYFGEFDYRFNGYWEDDGTSITTYPGYPPSTFHSVSRYAGDQVFAQGFNTIDFVRGTNDEDLFLERGTISISGSNDYAPTPFLSSVAVHDLHLHSFSDYVSAVRATTADGRIDVKWDPTQGPGCLDGVYVVRTNELQENWIWDGEVYSAGSMTINNVLTTRYSSPHTEQPLYPVIPSGSIRLDLKRNGNFSHDYEWRVPVGLKEIAQCSPAGGF